MGSHDDDSQPTPIEVVVYKKKKKNGVVEVDSKEPFVSVVVWPTSTVAELKKKVFSTSKKEGKVAPAVSSLQLYYQPEAALDGETGGVGPVVDLDKEFIELKDNEQIIAEIIDDGDLQLTVFMMDKTWIQTILDVGLFAVYMGLNIGINLYNKWMFSVLNFRIPLFNLVCHQFFIFLFLLIFVLFKMCTGFGLSITPVSCFKNKGRDFGLISALGVVGALNFGLTSVALMLLSQADLQIVRATIPFFVAISFAILEGRKFSAVEIFFMLVTVAGVVIVVVFHAQTWHMDITGLIIAVASNFAAALHMSLYALCNSILKLDAVSTIFYTVIPLGSFLIPFVFITHEPANIEAFLKNGHTIVEIVRVRIVCILVLGENSPPFFGGWLIFLLDALGSRGRDGSCTRIQLGAHRFHSTHHFRFRRSCWQLQNRDFDHPLGIVCARHKTATVVHCWHLHCGCLISG